ncbi:MAG: cytidylate kinase-like family protein [Dehalococcoidales bacterium]|nr:cytidylate kinase-like family protein [Dehalococcoidales bacterium]
MPVITIRGQLGSGAPEIGKLIADKLDTDYVDREIIAEVAALTKDSEERVIEKETPRNLLKRIKTSLERSYTFGDGWQGSYLPVKKVPLDDDRYVEALKSVILDLALNESIVICGRGSQFILKNYPRAFHVLVVAPLELRINYVMHKYDLPKKEAKKEIADSDNSHREFVKKYFNQKLEEPVHYDLVINTSRLSNETAAFVIVEAAKMKS